MRRGALLLLLLCWACGREEKPKAAPHRVPEWAAAKPGTTYDARSGLPKEVIHGLWGMEMVLLPAGTEYTEYPEWPVSGRAHDCVAENPFYVTEKPYPVRRDHLRGRLQADGFHLPDAPVRTISYSDLRVVRMVETGMNGPYALIGYFTRGARNP